jgi:hypothetical protein
MSRFGGEYKFPDELEEEKNAQEVDIQIEGDEVEVKIVDDTPQEDQFATPPLDDETQQELEKADESEEYSKNVKVKFKQYKKAWHDERRAKESALREQQEALTVAERILDENKRLKSMIHTGEKELISTYQSSAEMELDKAERNYREAYDSGDSDKVLAAQKELVRAEMKLDKAKNFKPTVQVDENRVQTTQTNQPATQQMDPKVANWVSNNPWFVDRHKLAMRKYAEGVHEELAERYGRGYIGTDEYYGSIDKEVRKRFPEEFASTTNNVEEEKPQRTKPSTVVAPAKRSTAPKQVVLTKTQVALAKKLKLTNEQYAREMMKLEA